ncbi:MAG: tRNA 2-thiocytidine(32) synthetase TtcA [Rhizobiales bacterium]|nr:tRNA 2-thiocytidine(32) synthetase TtcA [Hyphomicrobiales bacterium]
MDRRDCNAPAAVRNAFDPIEPKPQADTAGGHSLFSDTPDSVGFKKLRKRLVRQTRQAIEDYAMLAPLAGRASGAPEPARRRRRARWLVCLSGGKDSYTLLAVLLDLQWQGLLDADLVACNLDQGQPHFPANVLPEFLERHGIAHRIERRDTYSVVTAKVPQGQTYCALCSRLRRANLYRIAREEDCDAVVLGHHREDILETFLLNLFHGGRLETMPPRLVNDEGDLLVLRPLALCSEADIARFAEAMRFPIIPCDLCGSQDGLQRNAMKAMLASWEREFPGRKQTMLRALANVRPSHLLDHALLQAVTRGALATSDRATATDRMVDPSLANPTENT